MCQSLPHQKERKRVSGLPVRTISGERREKDEYTVIKTLASLLVVIAHVTTFYTYAGGVVPMPPNAWLDRLTTLIYSFHMPLFIFVSGAVYHRCIVAGKYKRIPAFIVKKAKRIMLPYYVWGIFYVTPVMVLLGFTEQPPFEYIVKGILCNTNSRHLWFLWTLFFVSVGIRLLQPLMRRAVPKYMLLCALLVVWYASRYVTGRYGISSIMQYALWYDAGYLFDEQKARMDTMLRGNRWVPVLCLLILPARVLSGGNAAAQFFSACAGILLCYWAVLHGKQLLCRIKGYAVLERDSFGLYLAHPMIIYLCFYLFRDGMYNPYVTCAVVTLVAIAGSVLLTELLRRFRLQVLLGE